MDSGRFLGSLETKTPNTTHQMWFTLVLMSIVFCTAVSPRPMLAAENEAASPWIDYFSAPFTYESDSRWLGGSAHFRTAVESVTVNGKLWLSEMDQGSFLGGRHPGEKLPQVPGDLPDSVAAIRRNVAQSLLRGRGLWFYDFGPHGKDGAGWWHPWPIWDRAQVVLRLSLKCGAIGPKERGRAHEVPRWAEKGNGRCLGVRQEQAGARRGSIVAVR